MIGRAVIALSLLLAVTETSAAQLAPEPVIGTRIPTAPEDFAFDRTRDVMHLFAQCSIKKRPELAHAMILDVSTHKVTKEYGKLADPDCLVTATLGKYDVTQLQMTSDIYRFALAGALFEKNLAAYNPQNIGQAAPLVTPEINDSDYAPKPGKTFSQKELEENAVQKSKAEGGLALTKYGECVVRKDPHGSFRLLSSKINTDEELAALRALMPAFGACLDRGAQFKSDSAALRGAVALNFYRLAYAPKITLPAKAAQ